MDGMYHLAKATTLFATSEPFPREKNFYGFDPAKIPSQAAYKLGVKAAEEIIERSLKGKEKNTRKKVANSSLGYRDDP